ncbi:MAG TPA: fused MFS/spermidine synthase [Candidatus Limnocylindrales bacterium]|nr:fused MFS/spermidine synthase [Candidatus Limnocylindrales bacterium]
MHRSPAVVGIFVLSGAAGLIYEIVWSRQLVLVFGNTTQAVSAILTGFFGGMAIGAAIGGRIADRVRSPLRFYGILELALVVVVLVTPLTFGLIHEAYRGIYPSLEGTPWLAVARLVLAVLALAPATVMMGATFPALVRHLTRAEAVSEAFGRLYSANTLGAVAGTLLAGLVFIELFGLIGALRIGAAASGTAGLVALWLAQRNQTVEPIPSSSTPSAAATARTERQSIPWLPLVIAFVSGVTSLGYQVTWTRLLVSGTGGLTYVFTVILALFLVGIALGAAIFNRLRTRITDPVRVLAWTQFAVAILAIAGLILVISRPREVDLSDPFVAVGTLFVAAIAVVLPVTVVMGLAFPTASELLRAGHGRAGEASGLLLAANTTGAILGSLVIPFVLMPTIGSPAIVVVLAAMNVALGLALATRARPIARGPAAAGAAVGLAIVLAVATPGLIVQPNEALIAARGWRLFESREDEIASVQSGQKSTTAELWVGGTSMTLLTVDAKLMPILPLIARPNATRALVVAFGMGTAYRTALIAGLRTDAVELVPSVPKMFRHYYADATAVLADPNGRVVIADGRNHLELSNERFDMIVTDPPPPIQSSGVSVISSLEYYQQGHRHLAPGGVMMQWTPYGTTANELKDHIRTFASVFGHVTAVRGPGGYGFYMLGSDEPIDLAPDVAREVLGRPGILEDVSSAFDSPAATVDDWIAVIDRQFWIDDDALRAYAGPGPLITDDAPRPEYFLIRGLSEGMAR